MSKRDEPIAVRRLVFHSRTLLVGNKTPFPVAFRSVFGPLVALAPPGAITGATARVRPTVISNLCRSRALISARLGNNRGRSSRPIATKIMVLPRQDFFLFFLFLSQQFKQAKKKAGWCCPAQPMNAKRRQGECFRLMCFKVGVGKLFLLCFERAR